MATITINNKEYPIRFGLVVVRNFCEIKGIEKINDFGALFSQENLIDLSIEMLDNICLLIKEGIKDGCRRENKEFDLQIEDIYDGFENNPDLFANALAIFAESQNTTIAKKKTTNQNKKT